jgi:SAM-dependent methyltransferase
MKPPGEKKISMSEATVSNLRERLEKDYYRTHFHRGGGFSPEGYERASRYYRFLYKSLLPADRNIAILDIGSGAGHFLYFLKKEGYRNLFGVDRSSDQTDVCRERTGIPVSNEDALTFLRRNSSSFDVITAHHVIEHQDPDRLLGFVGAMCDATKAGGRIIVTVPNAATPWASYHRYHDLTHKLIFADDSLLQLFACVGLESVCLYACRGAPVDFLSSVRWLFSLLQDPFFKLSFAVTIGTGRGSNRKSLIVSPNIIAVAMKQ